MKRRQKKTPAKKKTPHDADHGEMNHSGLGDVPAGLEEAQQPTYLVGSKVIIHADHMPEMSGAEATVSDAFDTTVYTVTHPDDRRKLGEKP